MKLLSRPRTTEKLVESLKRLELGLDNDPTIARQRPTSEHDREAKALRSLSYSMIQEFYNHPERSYAVEAALLSPFCNDENYLVLFNAFVNLIAADSIGSSIPDINVLDSFSIMLQSTQIEHIGKKLPLGYAIQSLTNRLTTACSAANDMAQYELLRTLSTILDVMNEVKFEGISDTQIMQPLFDLLENAIRHPELRLSQAARYAKQALRGIHSDVSPWEKLGKSAWNVIRGGATIAGSVGTLDPNKLLEGLEALGEVANMVKLITDIIDELNNINDMNKDIQNLSPRGWYVALRYTDLVIQGRRDALLGSLLKNLKPSLGKDENFLCGLCALLEQAIHDKSDSKTIKVLREFLTDQRAISKSRRVREWVNLIVGPAKPTKPSRTNRLLSILKKLFSRLHRSREHSNTVEYQKVPSQIPGNVLLEKAWPICHEAKVFYADQIIRYYYTNEELGRLNIERLGNNERLPMDKCYINLAIVQHEENENKSIEPSSLPFHRRLAIWEPEESDRVSLEDLFRPKKDAEKENPVDYQRVLIRGQAGVGKSTLCKKIVYDHIYNDMWSEIINRIIWLPLRQLKGQDIQKYNIQRLLSERYFSNNPQDKELLAEALYDEISKEGSRTLFILDGLDEVLQEISSGESELLLSLLHQPRVIITTRPYAVRQTAIGNIDREFETVGFYAGQVGQYIEAVASNNAKTIQSFLSSHPTVEELARIPIQLDAFCYSFEKGALDEGERPQTMTQLYNATESIIWKKDVVRLERRFQDRLETITKEVALQLTLRETRDLIQGEVNALQALAFDAMNTNMEEFGQRYREKFSDRQDDLTKYLAKPKYQARLMNFKEFSFLRTSDGRSAAKNSSYHFLHLTFQEYFAAQYFVQHWPDKQLPQLGVSADEFLRREKYNPRFDIMWRFVVGLLHAKGDAKRFFETIEKEPYDLLGSAHQRLVNRCLEEVVELQKTADLKFWADLENYLKQWLLFGLKWQEDYIKWDLDFAYPERILQQCLSETNDERLQGNILFMLESYSRVSLNTVNEVMKYCEGSNLDMKISALRVLSSYKDSLPDKHFHTITNLIWDSDEYVQHEAFLILKKRLPDYANVILLQLMPRMKQENTYIRSIALKILKQIETLPKRTLLDMIAMIPDLNEENMKEMMSVFERQLDLSEEIVLKILDSIQQWMQLKQLLRKKLYREEFRPWIVAKQSGRIAPKVAERLLNMLKDPNRNVRQGVVYAFRGYEAEDDPDFLHKIMDIFQEPSLPNSAGLVLYFIENIPESILHRLVDCLENYDTDDVLLYNGIKINNSRIDYENETDMQSAAAGILASNRSNFSTAILQRINSLLDNSRKREIATKILLFQSHLPEQILQRLWDQLKDPRTRLEDQERILFHQSALPNNILEELVDLLQAEDAQLQLLAENFLCNYGQTLPKIPLERIAIALDCKNIHVQSTAMRVLSSQASLPSEILHKIISCIWHYGELSDEYIADFLSVKLVEQFVMMPELLSDIIRLLDHPSQRVQLKVMSCLKEVRHLPENILKEVAQLFNHPGRYRFPDVVETLAKQQFVLPVDILEKLVIQWIEFEGEIHDTSISVLLAVQPALPKKILQGLIAMLNHPENTEGAAKVLTESMAKSEETSNLLFDLLDEESFITLYKVWVKKSGGMQLTWCVDGKKSVISFPQGDRSIPLDKFKGAVRKARESLGFPHQDFGQVL